MSEWQTDPKTGQRYRMIGDIQEFETMVFVDGGQIPQSHLEAHNARMKAQREKERAEALERLKNAPPRRGCPFGDRTMQRDCTREACALFTGDGCALAQIDATHDTAGRSCPLSAFKCRTDCALYRGGCSLTNLLQKGK